MKNLIIITITLMALISCSDSDNIKENSVNNSPKPEQEQTQNSQRKDPTPKTITLKEVSRIALVEADQFINNAKQSGLDYSHLLTDYENAKMAYDNQEFKKAQKLAVAVRQKIEELMSNNK